MKKVPPYTIDFPPSLVREAVGLDVYEKSMLWVLASHKDGKAYASRDSLKEQLAFKGNRLYAVRRRLVAKGLISYKERGVAKTTVYRIDLDALLRWVEDPDRARLWANNDRAFAEDDEAVPYRPRRLGKAGVKQILVDAKRRPGRKRGA